MTRILRNIIIIGFILFFAMIVIMVKGLSEEPAMNDRLQVGWLFQEGQIGQSENKEADFSAVISFNAALSPTTNFALSTIKQVAWGWWIQVPEQKKQRIWEAFFIPIMLIGLFAFFYFNSRTVSEADQPNYKLSFIL